MKIVICLLICLLAFISGGEAQPRTFRIYRGSSFSAQRESIRREQSRQKANACIEKYLRSDSSSSLEDMCNNMKTTTECLRSVVDDYVGDDSHEKLKEALKNVEKHYEEACEGDGGDFRKKADVCLDNFTSYTENSPENFCENLRNATDCLTTAVDETIGEDQNAQSTLIRLENYYNKTCMDRETKAEKFKIEAEACLHNYMNSSVTDYSIASKEEKCSDMKTAVDCLKSAVNENFGEEKWTQDLLKELFLVKAYTVTCKEHDNKAENFKKKAEVCLNNLEPSIDESRSSTEEKCDRMRKTIDCLKRAVVDTFGEDKGAQDALKDLFLIKAYNTICKDSGVAGNKCPEDRGETCKRNLVQMMLDFDGNDGGTGFNDYLCKSLKTTFSCFQSAVDNCAVHHMNVEIKRDMGRLKRLMKDKQCLESGDENNDDEDDDEKKRARCVRENRDNLMMECINEKQSELMAQVLENDDVNENKIICSMYGMTATCMVGKMRTQCGRKAADYVKKDVDKMPRRIAEACAATGDDNMQTNY